MKTKRELGSAFGFNSIKRLILKLFYRTRQNIADRELSLFYRSSPMERKILMEVKLWQK